MRGSVPFRRAVALAVAMAFSAVIKPGDAQTYYCSQRSSAFSVTCSGETMFELAGAWGGGSQYSGGNNRGRGGLIKGMLNCQSSSTLSIHLGCPGGHKPCGRCAGGGGGGSGLLFNGRLVALAAGGGGGAGILARGGNGAYPNGQSGEPQGCGGGAGGTGGTQSSGGAGGGPNRGQPNGNYGSHLQGANYLCSGGHGGSGYARGGCGADNPGDGGGGGGGGGWYGGGSGASGCWGSSGGGGSSYITSDVYSTTFGTNDASTDGYFKLLVPPPPPRPPTVTGGTDYYGDSCPSENCPQNTCISVDSTTCRKCAEGRWGNGINCPECPAGYYREDPGTGSMFECIACPAGYFQYSSRSIACIACSAGRYEPNAASTAARCPNCPSGTYSNADAATECLSCEAGFYSRDGDDTTTCKPCQQGYAAAAVAAECVACANGKFAPLAESSSCDICPSGWISGSVAASSCTVCDPGKFAKEDQSRCELCPPSKYSSLREATNNSVCTACPHGLSPTLSRDDCVGCSAGKFRDRAKPGSVANFVKTFAQCWRRKENFSTAVFPGTHLSQAEEEGGHENVNSDDQPIMKVTRLALYEGQRAGIAKQIEGETLISAGVQEGDMCRVTSIAQGNAQSYLGFFSETGVHGSDNKVKDEVWPGEPTNAEISSIDSSFKMPELTSNMNFFAGIVFGESAEAESAIMLKELCFECYMPEKLLSAESDTCEGACAIAAEVGRMEDKKIRSDILLAHVDTSTTASMPSSAEADCAAILAKGVTKSGMYYVNGFGNIDPPILVFCDMEYDGGGWTLFADKTGGLCTDQDLGNAPDPRNGVDNQYRISDAKIQALQGPIGGKFRWTYNFQTRENYCGIGGKPHGCTPGIFFRYNEGWTNRLFYSARSSSGCGNNCVGNINECSSVVDGPYHGRQGYSTCCGHYGLDAYGAGGYHNGNCNVYLITCYGSNQYDGGNRGQYWVRASSEGRTSSGGDGSASETETCPDGDHTYELDLNLGQDDLGSVAGTLRFTGDGGFVMYLTADKSYGESGAQASGVNITSAGPGNCHAAGNCGHGDSVATAKVLGSYVMNGDADSLHSSGIVAVFNQGATKVTVSDSSDNASPKAVFAFDSHGRQIGSSEFGSQGLIVIDTTMTNGKLIYAVEFDTGALEKGGLEDDVRLTLDSMSVEGTCKETQIKTHPFVPCIGGCDEFSQYVKGCSGFSSGRCNFCDDSRCGIDQILEGCGGDFGPGQCVADIWGKAAPPSATLKLDAEKPIGMNAEQIFARLGSNVAIEALLQVDAPAASANSATIFNSVNSLDDVDHSTGTYLTARISGTASSACSASGSPGCEFSISAENSGMDRYKLIQYTHDKIWINGQVWKEFSAPESSYASDNVNLRYLKMGHELNGKLVYAWIGHKGMMHAGRPVKSILMLPHGICTACASCPAGKQRMRCQNAEKGHCENCPAGRFKADEGLFTTPCEICPDGWTSVYGASTCSLCSSSFVGQGGVCDRDCEAESTNYATKSPSADRTYCIGVDSFHVASNGTSVGDKLLPTRAPLDIRLSSPTAVLALELVQFPADGGESFSTDIDDVNKTAGSQVVLTSVPQCFSGSFYVEVSINGGAYARSQTVVVVENTAPSFIPGENFQLMPAQVFATTPLLYVRVPASRISDPDPYDATDFSIANCHFIEAEVGSQQEPQGVFSPVIGSIAPAPRMEQACQGLDSTGLAAYAVPPFSTAAIGQGYVSAKIDVQIQVTDGCGSSGKEGLASPVPVLPFSVSTSSVSLAGGDNITISGAGFVTGHSYTCGFLDQTTSTMTTSDEGRALSSSSILCPSPKLNHPAGSVELRISAGEILRYEGCRSMDQVMTLFAKATGYDGSGLDACLEASPAIAVGFGLSRSDCYYTLSRAAHDNVGPNLQTRCTDVCQNSEGAHEPCGGSSAATIYMAKDLISALDSAFIYIGEIETAISKSDPVDVNTVSLLPLPGSLVVEWNRPEFTGGDDENMLYVLTYTALGVSPSQSFNHNGTVQVSEEHGHGNILQRTLTYLHPTAQYAVSIEATNSVGSGGSTDALKMTTLAAERPDAAANLAVESIGAYSFAVSFDMPQQDGGARLTEYRTRYWREQDDGCIADENITVHQISTESTSTTLRAEITGLRPESEYFFEVNFLNAAGKSGPTAPPHSGLSILTRAETAPITVDNDMPLEDALNFTFQEQKKNGQVLNISIGTQRLSRMHRFTVAATITSHAGGTGNASEHIIICPLSVSCFRSGAEGNFALLLEGVTFKKEAAQSDSSNSSTVLPQSGGILLIDSVSHPVIIKNVIFQGGRASSDGGMIAIRSCGYTKVTITASRFDDGAATMLGGAISVASSFHVTIGEETTFKSIASARGGAIAVTENAEVAMTGTTFSGTNAEHQGGAIFVSDGAITVEDSAFHESGVSAKAGVGGAIYIQMSKITLRRTTLQASTSVAGSGGSFGCVSSTAQIEECDFQFNAAAVSGGDIFSHLCNLEVKGSNFSRSISPEGEGGSIKAIDGEQCDIRDCSFSRSSAAGRGGAINLERVRSATIFRSKVADSSSEGGGGAVYCGDSVLDIRDSSFERNVASGEGAHGGALLFFADEFQCSEESDDGDAYPLSCKSRITRSSFIENAATSGGGGAIFWQLGKPEALGRRLASAKDGLIALDRFQLTAANNTANYGNFVASSPFRLMRYGASADITAVPGSKVQPAGAVAFQLADFYGQPVTAMSASMAVVAEATISAVGENCTWIPNAVSGTGGTCLVPISGDISKVSNSLATFPQLRIFAPPSESYGTGLSANLEFSVPSLGSLTRQSQHITLLQCDAGTFLDSDSMTCEDCPLGKFLSARSDNLECELCPAGWFGGSEGHVACSACESGRISASRGSDACKECSAGRWTNMSTGNSECISCPAGRFGMIDMVQRAGSCISCPAGFFQENSRSTSCEKCFAGFFSEVKGGKSCQICPAGRQSVAGATSCKKLCPSGTFKTLDLVSCMDCPAGYSTSPTQSPDFAQTGSEKCWSCSPGRFSSAGSASCVLCALGRSSKRGSAYECEYCAEGKYSPEIGSIECHDCESGLFSEGSAASCKVCEMGQFTMLQEGASACSECPIGKYGAIRTASNRTENRQFAACIDCPINTFENATGSIGCSKCARARWTDGKIGQNQCISCAEGTFFDAHGNCVLCPAGKYTFSRGGSVCLTCPTGASCRGGTSLEPKWGWWRSDGLDRERKTHASRALQESRGMNGGDEEEDKADTYITKEGIEVKLSRCRGSNSHIPCETHMLSENHVFSRLDDGCEACRSLEINSLQKKSGSNETGYIFYELQGIDGTEMREPVSNLPSSLVDYIVDGNRTKYPCNILKGYSGRLCSSCLPGYARVDTAGCKRCPPLRYTIAVMVIGALTAAVALVWMIYLVVSDAGTSSSASAVKRIVLNHMQMVSILLHFDMKWSPATQEMFKLKGMISSLTENLVQTDCALGEGHMSMRPFWIKQIVYALLGVTALLIAAMFWSGRSLHRRCTRKRRERAKKKNSAMRATADFLMKQRLQAAVKRKGGPQSGGLNLAGWRERRGRLLARSLIEHIRSQNIDLQKKFAEYDRLGIGEIPVEDFIMLLQGFSLDWSNEEYLLVAELFDGGNGSRDGRVEIAHILSFEKTAMDKFFLTASVIMYCLYPTLCRKLLQQLACKGGLLDGPSEFYLYYDLESPCYDSVHIVMLAIVGVPAIVVYLLGFPIIGTFLISRSIRRRGFTNDTTMFRYAVLLSGYKKDNWYWESVICARKVFLIGLGTFGGSQGVQIQFFLAILAIGFCLCLQLTANPFSNSEMNRIESWGLGILLLTLYSGLLFYWQVLEPMALDIVAVFVVFMNAMYMCWCFGTLLREHLQREGKLGSTAEKCLARVKTDNGLVTALIFPLLLIFYLLVLIKSLFCCSSSKGASSKQQQQQQQKVTPKDDGSEGVVPKAATRGTLQDSLFRENDVQRSTQRPTMMLQQYDSNATVLKERQVEHQRKRSEALQARLSNMSQGPPPPTTPPPNSALSSSSPAGDGQVQPTQDEHQQLNEKEKKDKKEEEEEEDEDDDVLFL